QLSEFLFMETDPMFLDQANEFLGRITSEGRNTKARIRRKIILRRSPQIGEIAAAATGDSNFQTNPSIPFEQGHPPPALPTGGAASDHDHIVGLQSDFFPAQARLLEFPMKPLVVRQIFFNRLSQRCSSWA